MAEKLTSEQRGTRNVLFAGLAIGVVVLVAALLGPPLISGLFPGDGTGSPGNPTHTRQVEQRNETRTLPNLYSGQGGATPAPATNQCWDTATNEPRDKTAPTSAKQTKETAVGVDRSPGAPAPPSGNAAGSGMPKNANAVRPGGVSDC